MIKKARLEERLRKIGSVAAATVGAIDTQLAHAATLQIGAAGTILLTGGCGWRQFFQLILGPAGPAAIRYNSASVSWALTGNKHALVRRSTPQPVCHVACKSKAGFLGYGRKGSLRI